MRRIFPYPLLFVALVVFWLLLNGFTRAQFILALPIAFFACLAMTALQPRKNHIRSMPALARLCSNLAVDVVHSNIAVARTVLSGGKRQRQAGFVIVPLELENSTALAVLSILITMTPGTAWVDSHAARRELTIHVLDLDDADAWRDLVKRQYEKPLIEIFGTADATGEEKAT